MINHEGHIYQDSIITTHRGKMDCQGSIEAFLLQADKYEPGSFPQWSSTL